MVKEISISKNNKIMENIKNKIDDNLSKKENIEKIAELLRKKYKVKFNFCQIKGDRRWSYTAGYQKVIIDKKKIKINNELGLIVENYEELSEEKWADIISLIKDIYYENRY